MLRVVKIHSAGTKGGYSYCAASVFKVRASADGKRLLWIKDHCVSERSTINAASKDGRRYANEHKLAFVEGYGSLHNAVVDPRYFPAVAAQLAKTARLAPETPLEIVHDALVDAGNEEGAEIARILLGKKQELLDLLRKLV